GGCCASGTGGLCGDGLLQNEGDLGHRGVVALTVLQLDDAGVTTGTVLELGCKLVEQVGNDVLVGDQCQNVTTVCDGTGLCLGDQLLGVGTQSLCLGIGGLDSAVLEQRSSQVRKNLLLVARGTAETGALLRGRHGVLLVYVWCERGPGAYCDLLGIFRLNIDVATSLGVVAFKGGWIEVFRSILQGQTQTGELDLDLIDRLLSEVADIQQIGLSAL